jgi:hypothetical protein
VVSPATYPDMKCLLNDLDITDCEKDVTWKSTLEEFFQAFKDKKRDQDDVWKLGVCPFYDFRLSEADI